MLLIGTDLNNKGLLIGENDAHYLRPVTCARIRVSSIKIFMAFLLFLVAKINAYTQQDMTSLRTKLEQFTTLSYWCANDACTFANQCTSFSPINKPLLFKSVPINNIPRFCGSLNKKV